MADPQVLTAPLNGVREHPVAEIVPDSQPHLIPEQYLQRPSVTLKSQPLGSGMPFADFNSASLRLVVSSISPPCVARLSTYPTGARVGQCSCSAFSRAGSASKHRTTALPTHPDHFG